MWYVIKECNNNLRKMEELRIASDMRSDVNTVIIRGYLFVRRWMTNHSRQQKDDWFLFLMAIGY